MGEDNEKILYDLVVIGAGMTGMAASLYAADKGLSTLQCGSSSGLAFSSGMLDLMAVFPIAENRRWENPWEALKSINKSTSRHPYSKLSEDSIKQALDGMLEFFKDYGFEYRFSENENVLLPTAQGTLKPTYLVPQSMWNGTAAFAEKKPCLIVDFKGLREFSAFQVKENLGKVWPGLKCVRVNFPGMGEQGEVHPEHMARALENKNNVNELAKVIKDQLSDERYIGLPAILGIHQTKDILETLEKELSVSIFEIPTPTVSVSGLRIKEMFSKGLPDRGVIQLDNSRVSKAQRLENGNFGFQIQHNNMQRLIEAKSAILASGRFFGGGLKASRHQIKETVFDIPVNQPEDRRQWHNIEFFDKKGHPVNQAGIDVDQLFRPLDTNRKPVFKNLFAAGSILAYQDWIREKSGSGIAVSSAFAAVASVFSYLQK